MELKEIWEQEGKELIKENFPISLRQWGMTDQEILDCMEESFIRGCALEHNRSHWFDPEKELPPRNKDQDTNRSIYVLVKDSYDTISEKQYNFQGKYWEDFEAEEGKVISWAYIPK